MKLSDVQKRALVDKLGQLDEEIASLEAKKKHASELRGEIRSWFPKLGAAASATHPGHKYLCTIGPMENETSILSMQAVFDALGAKEFIARCGFTLKALREALMPDKAAPLIATKRTGTRPVKTFAVAKPK